MKNWIAALFLTAVATTNAQEKISDYKYVIVSKAFNGFEENEYGLNNRVKYNLEQKKYIVLNSDQTTWPEEVINNPCLASTANINKKKSFLTNKLEVVFTDCRNNNIGTFEGNSRIKDYEKGFQEAVKLAFNTVNIQNAIPSNKIVANTKATEKSTNPVYIPETKSVEIEKTNLLTDGTSTYQKVDLQNGGFMVMSENGNQVVAKFETTLKTGIYRVTVTHGNSSYTSVGYNNGNAVSYEVLQNNNWKEIKLTAK